MIDIINSLLADHQGYDVLWDYCLSNNILMPSDHIGPRSDQYYSFSGSKFPQVMRRSSMTHTRTSGSGGMSRYKTLIRLTRYTADLITGRSGRMSLNYSYSNMNGHWFRHVST